MSLKRLGLVAVAVTIGCSHNTGGPSTVSGVPRKTNILAAAEIVAARADQTTAYDAVARLRPNWLVSHGLSSFDLRSNEYAIVFVDGQRFGTVEALRDIPAYQVARVRYYDVTQAGSVYGIKGGTGGVIEVTTK
jgi:hypothetical protein